MEKGPSVVTLIQILSSLARGCCLQSNGRIQLCRCFVREPEPMLFLLLAGRRSDFVLVVNLLGNVHRDLQQVDANT